MATFTDEAYAEKSVRSMSTTAKNALHFSTNPAAVESKPNGQMFNNLDSTQLPWIQLGGSMGFALSTTVTVKLDDGCETLVTNYLPLCRRRTLCESGPIRRR